MANPAFRDFDKQLGNTPTHLKRGPRGKEPGLSVKTANWPGLPGKSGPNRSAGVKKTKTYATSTGL